MLKDKLIDRKKMLWVDLEVNWLVKMIRDAVSKFDDYSISPKIRQILLDWGYELIEKDFLMSCQINAQKWKCIK